MLHELKQSFSNCTSTLEALKPSLNYDELSETIRQREAEIEEPSFWDNNTKAQSILKELNQLKSKKDQIDHLHRLQDDISTYFELLSDSEDPEDLESTQALLKEFVDHLNVLETHTLLSGTYDNEDCIFSITAGAGAPMPKIGQIFYVECTADTLIKAELNYTIEESNPGEEAGLKSVTITVKGDYAYGFLKTEIGVHRLVRLSPFNANNKRQTSFAAVDVIPNLPEANTQLDIPSDDLRIDTYRASGAGGQHVNKTSSAVRITHIPTGTVAQSQSSRSQGANKEAAMAMLKSRLMQQLAAAHKETLDELSGASNEIAWGHQIRSYVFHPYQLVKDHRTEHETSQLQHVLDGDIYPFIIAFLRHESETDH